MIRRTAILFILGLVFGTLSAQAGTKTILLRVETPPQAWSNSEIQQHLTRQLSRNPTLRIVAANGEVAGQPEFPGAIYDLDSLVNWGVEAGGRYLLLVRIDDERLERVKTFSLPLIFHKWEVRGVIEGEVRLIDLHRSRLLVAKNFRVEKRAKQIFQGSMDDNKYDPDIHLSAPDQIRFFSQLGKKSAAKVQGMIRAFISGR